MPPRPRELSSRCAVFRSSTSALVTTTSFSSKDAKRARPGQRLWSAALAGDCSPFSFCEPEACSILLRGANEFMLGGSEQIGQALSYKHVGIGTYGVLEFTQFCEVHDALCAVSRTLESKCGGSWWGGRRNGAEPPPGGLLRSRSMSAILRPEV